MNQRNSNNTRKFERFQPEVAGVVCEMANQPGGRLRDISIGGAGVCFSKPLTVGSKCIMGISSPKGRFDIQAEIVWVEKGSGARCRDAAFPFLTGLRFDLSAIEQSKDLVFALLNSN